MQSAAQSAAHLATQPGSLSKKSLWAGRILSGFVMAFLLLDAVLHLAKPAPVVEAFTRLGFPLRLAVVLGIIELACIVVYLIPRTSVARWRPICMPEARFSAKHCFPSISACWPGEEFTCAMTGCALSFHFGASLNHYVNMLRDAGDKGLNRRSGNFREERER
jgi:hypothetical protein